MRLLIPFALLACGEPPTPVLVYAASPPPTRTVISIVIGSANERGCPSHEGLMVEPIPYRADVPAQIDLQGEPFCEAMQSSAAAPIYFVAEIELAPRWHDDCVEDYVSPSCLGWGSDTIGTITRMVPARDRDDAATVLAQITAHGFPRDAIR